VDFRALTFEQVSAHAEEVDARLPEEARTKGHAETVTGTEDSDWLKLRVIMDVQGAEKLADLRPETANEWAERMSAHARIRGKRNKAHPSEHSDGGERTPQ
jgi:hypothetical protein